MRAGGRAEHGAHTGWGGQIQGQGHAGSRGWGVGNATREPEQTAKILVLSGAEGHLPDRKGEVALVLTTGPSQEAPVDTSALEQGLCVQPTEVSMKPPGRPRRAVRRSRMGSRPPMPPAYHGSQALTSPSWGLPKREGVQGTRWCRESGQVEHARGKPAPQPSAPRPPHHPCSPGSGAATPMAQGSQKGGDRKGRGPLGGTHCTSHFRAEGREAEPVEMGVGMGPTSHVCHQRPQEHGSAQIRTHMCLVPPKQRSCSIHVTPHCHMPSLTAPHSLP